MLSKTGVQEVPPIWGAHPQVTLSTLSSHPLDGETSSECCPVTGLGDLGDKSGSQYMSSVESLPVASAEFLCIYMSLA